MRRFAVARLCVRKVSHDLRNCASGELLRLTEKQYADENLAVSRGAVNLDRAKVTNDVRHLFAKSEHFNSSHGSDHDGGDTQSPFDIFNPDSLRGLGPSRQLECS